MSVGKKIHNDGLHKYYSSPDIKRIIKSKLTPWERRILPNTMTEDTGSIPGRAKASSMSVPDLRPNRVLCTAGHHVDLCLQFPIRAHGLGQPHPYPQAH
jgi:hypothetical protein